MKDTLLTKFKGREILHEDGDQEKVALIIERIKKSATRSCL